MSSNAVETDAMKRSSALCEEGHKLLEQAKYAEAIKLFEQALHICEKFCGLDHCDVADILSDIADCYHALKQYEFELPLRIRQLKICQASLGAEHFDSHACLIQIGCIYEQLNAWELALPVRQQELEISEKKYGLAGLAGSVNNLAKVYEKLGQHDRAITLIQTTIDRYAKAYDSDLNNLLSLISHQITIFDTLNQSDQAIPLRKRLAEIEQSKLLSENGRALLAQGNCQEAIIIFQQNLALCKVIFGIHHGYVADTLIEMGDCYRELKQYEDAIFHYQRAMEIYEKGTDFSYLEATSKTLWMIASCQIELRQFEQSLPVAMRALDIFEHLNGLDNQGALKFLRLISISYFALAQFDKALPICLRIVAILDKFSGLENEEGAWALSNLAAMHGELKQYDQSLHYYQQVINIRQVALGYDHADTRLAVTKLAAIYGQLESGES